jgi:hypothetical protein
MPCRTEAVLNRSQRADDHGAVWATLIVVGWLCRFTIGAALGLSGYFAVQHYFEVRWYGRGTVALMWPVLILIYATCYPLGRVLATRFGAASKPIGVARYLWRLCTIGAVVLVSMLVIFNPAPQGRPQFIKAMADTRAIASAIRMYVRHCGGLPVGDSATDCPVAMGSGGPYFLPQSLLLQQTNAQGQMGGPFLNSLPKLPGTNWTGAGSSYAYYIVPGGKFLICAQGDRTAENSDGGKSCP